MLTFMTPPAVLSYLAGTVAFILAAIGFYSRRRARAPRRPRPNCYRYPRPNFRKENPSPDKRVPMWRVI